MRLIAGAAVLAAALAALLLWQTGAFDALSRWAALQQRAFQDAMAASVSALRRGDAAALWTLLAVSAGYGFAHAVGPGHGKVLLGGAALGSRATARRMAALALASSLAQSASAILLVYGGLMAVEVSARWAVGAAERVLAPASYAAIAGIGLLLAWRGMRALARARGAGSAGEGGAGEGGGHAGCGHRHGPDAAEVARLSGWRDAALLVGGIAIRPCTGAIFLLVIAWRFDLVWQGLVAVVAMGLGTAAFTVLVAVGGVAARGATLFASAGGGRAGALALPVLQLGAGLGVALLATGLLAGSLRL